MQEKVTKEIVLLTRKIDDISQFRETLLTKIRKVIFFDAACFTTIDSNTFLSTGAYTDERIEKIHPELFMNEFLEKDYNKFKNLAQIPPYIASLNGVTNNDRMKSSRYCNILIPAGFGDEIRAVFVSKGKCFGHLSLFRDNANPLFTNEECAYLSTIIPLVGDALRRSAFIIPSAERIEPMETGTLLLNTSFELMYANQSGKDWLLLLRKWEKLNQIDLPRPIRAVCSRVKANQGDKEEKVCMCMPSGQFLVIRASEMKSYNDLSNCYTVLLEMARPQEVFTLVAESYDLSLREKQVIDGVLRGLSTKELASQLHISIYTVQDHLKSIFTKVRVSSRSELVWEVFSRFSIG
ncbi:LuxR family transcriptional regulator [Bacillus gaemokensis]|uniref:LuxR family transcriptional regulator n=1 Tax=Bacillus gaemokensis TaxID=574375 RepID=A0A073K620_9BACI|nr:helix-turn-helix transcriptional regulator [Bacillus gaemokensis]KEK21961.1 LuxR family transcriptional regulator [Bacillus gaemokensis]KYG39505.1 helix-turn-helix transcriptional regulator [Bacillus gaemokensis]